jgi:hypothetical protein
VHHAAGGVFLAVLILVIAELLWTIDRLLVICGETLDLFFCEVYGEVIVVIGSREDLVRGNQEFLAVQPAAGIDDGWLPLV